MRKQPPIHSQKAPENLESPYHPSCNDDPIECPGCKENKMEFKYYYWDRSGRECEQWVCSGCKLEVNF